MLANAWQRGYAFANKGIYAEYELAGKVYLFLDNCLRGNYLKIE